MNYRVDIMAVLLRAFIKKHNIILDGVTPDELFGQLQNFAMDRPSDDLEAQEVLAFLDDIEERDLIESFFK